MSKWTFDTIVVKVAWNPSTEILVFAVLVAHVSLEFYLADFESHSQDVFFICPPIAVNAIQLLNTEKLFEEAEEKEFVANKPKMDELVDWIRPTGKIEKKLGFKLQVHFKVGD